MRGRRYVLAVAVVAVLSLAPVTSVEAASPAARYSQAAFQETNERRANHDRVRLDRHTCLKRFAIRQARRMAARQNIWHQNLGRIQRRCNMSWVGENVAAGYPNGRAVVRGWMHSPGHRENILRPQFRKMGIAARRGNDGRWYVAQVFGTRR